MVEVNMEWNLICRVCLQEGDLSSIFDKDSEANISYDEKIMQCSSIIIRQGLNLPEQICSSCINDLSVAYTFRINCESSDAILQSFADSQIVTDLVVSSNAGRTYHYKPPSGLDVRRIRADTHIKEEPNSNDEEQEEHEVHEVEHQEEEELEEEVEPEEEIDESQVEFLDATDEQFVLEDSNDLVEDMTENEMKIPKNVRKALRRKLGKSSNSDIEQNHDNITLTMEELVKSENIDIQTVRPVKSNKYNRSKVINIPTSAASIENITTQISPDGVETTVIRVKRNLSEQKPMKICEICGNTYKYRHALDSHMRRHRGEKPFACDICGRAFVIAFELKRHMRTHNGQKPYGCKYCDRKFSDFGSRIKHERTHTGERPYHCGTCGKAFAYSHVLSSHMLTHTGEKKFNCEQCGKRFAKSHHLKAHLNTHLRVTNKTNIKSPNQKILNNLMKDSNTNTMDVISLFDISSSDEPKLEPMSEEEEGDDENELNQYI